MPLSEPEVRRLKRRFEPSPEQRITDALGKLLTAIEAGDADGTSGTAYRSALVRHGESLGKAGGTAAMQTALDAVCAASPDRADARQKRITAAWAGIAGWNAR